MLYELLTGRRAFEGATVSDTLAGVLRADPEWRALPPQTPPSVVSLVKRCLAKDRRQRLSDLNDARLEIAEALHFEPALPAALPRSRRWLPVLIGLTALSALIGAAGLWSVWPFVGLTPSTAAPAPALFSVITLPARVERSFAEGFALSNDGRYLVFAGHESMRRALYRRPLAADTIEQIPDTANAGSPFFSPDSRWIGFFLGNEVRKVAIDGGSAMPICGRPGVNFGGGTFGVWLDQQRILFRVGAPDDVAGLYVCPSNGGTAARLDIDIRPTAVARLNPRQVLVQSGGRDNAVIHLVDVEAKQVRRLTDGAAPHFVEPDILLFTRGESLWAARLDLRAGTLDASIQMPIGVSFAGVRNPLFAASATGTVAFVPRSSSEQSLVWVTRAGAVTPSRILPDASLQHPSLSPDGRTLAVSRTTREGENVVACRSDS